MSASLSEQIPDDIRLPRRTVAAIWLLAGFAFGLLLAVALIPAQPDRVLVPVPQQIDQPATDNGLRAKGGT